ncbi:MAG: sulfide/dihydroorotate dehydrogenase-like FAD/NAD-binding protein [Eubacteriales bacterium]|jgi:ferredoxin--NADP+ reductase|nr:sulfide/dihydroorotate dehydrogenase-like FAD/NAD-binding protein [Eubacteriales bacterium]
MFRIVEKDILNPTITRLVIEAPFVAKKAQPGQFIILRTYADSERIPFTVAGTDPEKGTVTIIYQIVGASTLELNQIKVGESLADFVGPLGKPSELEGLKHVAIVGGGAGCAIAYPLAYKLHQLGADVCSVAGFRNKDLVILEKEFEEASNKFIKMSDDGTWGTQGFVTKGLEDEILLRQGKDNEFDEVIAIGPIVMMKNIALLTKKYNIKTVVSMNPIMIDGTGMCGCCRVLVGGKMKFACVDGPDFDGWEVDYDSAAERNTMYRSWERKKYDDECNLLKGAN